MGDDGTSGEKVSSHGVDGDSGGGDGADGGSDSGGGDGDGEGEGEFQSYDSGEYIDGDSGPELQSPCHGGDGIGDRNDIGENDEADQDGEDIPNHGEGEGGTQFVSHDFSASVDSGGGDFADGGDGGG